MMWELFTLLFDETAQKWDGNEEKQDEQEHSAADHPQRLRDLLLARLVQVYPTQSSCDKMLLECRDESSRSQAAQQREPEIH